MELRRLPDDRLEETVRDQVRLAVGDQYDREAEILAGQPEGARAVYATIYLEGDVDNGGFDQYFWNSEGKLANEALRGYELLGAPRHAQIVGQAIAAWEKERPQQQSFKEKGTLEAFSESYKHSALGSLDDAFYALERKEDPAALRIAYIRRHPDRCVVE